MCEPTTLAGVAVVGAGLSAYSQYKQGQSDAEVASTNAMLAGFQQRDAVQRGAYGAADIMTEGRRATASAQAAVAGNGIDSTTGSAANLFTASMVNAGVDADRAKANAAREAWGYANEARDSRTKAKMAKEAGYLGALGTGLSGIGNAAVTYKTLGK